MSTTNPFPGPGAPTAADEARLTKQLDFVRKYMLDGCWHTFSDITEAFYSATGRHMMETSASAHIRALRKAENGGFDIDRQQVHNGNGLHEYRLVVSPVRQKRLRIALA